MKIYIGHYKDDPTEWWLASAESEDDAILAIDAHYGEPEETSIREVTGHFTANFRAIREPCDGDCLDPPCEGDAQIDADTMNAAPWFEEPEERTHILKFLPQASRKSELVEGDE